MRKLGKSSPRWVKMLIKVSNPTWILISCCSSTFVMITDSTLSKSQALLTAICKMIWTGSYSFSSSLMPSNDSDCLCRSETKATKQWSRLTMTEHFSLCGLQMRQSLASLEILHRLSVTTINAHLSAHRQSSRYLLLRRMRSRRNFLEVPVAAKRI